MLGRTRVTAGAVLLLAIAMACTSPAPTPSQPPPTSAAPSATARAIPDADAPYPTSVFGLPVLTVDAASQLLIDGKIDGRVVAVSGYWMEGMPMGCPYGLHRPALSTACLSVGLADKYLHLGSYTENSYSWSASQGFGLLIPLTVGETSQEWNGALPSQMSSDNPNPAQRVVVIGHAGDARLWQCEPDTRRKCGDVFVVDRVAWVNGVEQNLRVPYTELEPSMSVDAALAAAAIDPAHALAALPVRSDGVAFVDPRLSGVGGNLVWMIRAIAGDPDASGTAPAQNVVVDDRTAQILATVPLAVPDDYAAARLSVYVDDMRTPSGGSWGYATYVVVDPAEVALAGSISDPPLVLAPGSYTLRGLIQGATPSPPPGSTCEETVEVGSTDVSMIVRFAADATCSWAPAPPGM